MRIAVLGAGNGGQAIAGYLSLTGHNVSLFDINTQKVDALKKKGGIRLVGCIEGFGKVQSYTDDIAEAMEDAEVVMVTTVANAHSSIAESIAPYVKDGMVIILNPGRTCGALVFNQTLKTKGVTCRYYLGEAQTLVYACRITENGTVNIIGVKDEVFLAGLPASDTAHIIQVVNKLYSCFRPVPNVLYTSLENIGAMFHPCVCLFNAATIERQEEFWFYRDMTDQVAQFIEQFDQERLMVGKAYDIELINVKDWIRVAYKGTSGETLCDLMKNNPAYYEIKAPGSIFTRQLTEDIPTGVLPIMELGMAAGVNITLMQSMIRIIQSLLGIDFYSSGRSLKNLGLEGKSKGEIIDFITYGE